MRNPWLALPDEPPYILPEDQDAVSRFNEKAHADHFIHLDQYPEPFLGRPDAPVVLLNLNPGYEASESYFHQHHAHFIRTCLANLRHETTGYPFYLLNPGNHESGGYKWWAKHLRRLIEDCTHERVARHVLAVEYFGYHSRRYGSVGSVPSQQYGFALVHKAMARSAIIVQMRNKKRWQKAIPELACYSHYYTLNSPQAVYVTPNNCPSGYDKIVTAINNA